MPTTIATVSTAPLADNQEGRLGSAGTSSSLIGTSLGAGRPGGVASHPDRDQTFT